MFPQSHTRKDTSVLANISYSDLRRLVRQAVPRHRSPHETYGDEDVVVAFLWAERHNQPTCWAAEKASYPPGVRGKPPSQSTLSKRLRTVPVIGLLSRTRRAMADAVPGMPEKQIDCRPLTVGNSSGDRDARRGRAAGGTARGYKLCLVTSAGLVREWTLTPLNVNDQIPAATLAADLPRAGGTGWGYVAADNAFDSNKVHAAFAAAGHALVAPPRASNEGVRDSRRNTPERIRNLDHSDSPLWGLGEETLGLKVLRGRVAVEHTHGQATFFGLGQLPPWVRTPHRVALHVEARLIFQTWRKLELMGVSPFAEERDREKKRNVA